MPTDTQQIIKDRHKTHGDYRKVFDLSQFIKAHLRSGNQQLAINRDMAVHLEALDMIAVKIARITHGDPNEIDHWQDIAGYAQIVVNHIEEGFEMKACTGEPTKPKAQLSPNGLAS